MEIQQRAAGHGGMRSIAIRSLAALARLGTVVRVMSLASWFRETDETTSWKMTFRDSPVRLLDGSYATGPVWYRLVNGKLQFSLMTDEEETDLWIRHQW